MDEKENVTIIVATHKMYRMPKDSLYLPLQVGAAGSALDLGFQRDDCGDNISLRNPGFCELTGLYWAWKNLDADYIGLVHYRRYFGVKRKNSFEGILTFDQLKKMLDKYQLFVPKKRNYYIETLYSHYAHTHYAKHLDMVRDILKQKYPEYLDSYDTVISRRSGYMFNMCIMKQNLLNDYCEWLFDILFSLEEELDDSDLSAFQSRLYGRVSEIIFNVWLEQKLREGIISKATIKELPYIYMEKIDWIKKISSFLKAKYAGKKYEKSF